MPDNCDELDRLLDSALATYADPGVDSGLEDRILKRVAAEVSPASRRRWLAWAIALPAAAGLLFFILLSRSGTNHPYIAPPQQAHLAQQPSATSNEAANRRPSSQNTSHQAVTPLRKPRLGRANLEARPAPLPKLEIYPTPRPLTPQEEALVNFATHATKSEREALIAAQRQNDAPLSVAAIEIKPLEAPALGAD